jgi:leader peptidase (prepilin peptidase)/N-methyltransferase
MVFFFALGACIGSFLNVVVWRLPRGESLIRPPSHCPKCDHPLAWRDNIPVFGWIFLRGKCRYCGNPISPRYPIVEAIVGLLFVGYYVAFFVLQVGPCPDAHNGGFNLFDQPINRPMTLQQDWPIYLLYMFLIACLFAASLIDAELYLIPPSITWWAAGVGMVVHAIVDDPKMPGAVNASAPACALSLGAGIGLIISVILLRLGILPLSFEEGTPELEIDKQRRAESGASDEPPPREYTRAEIRCEMRKEMLFLMPPLVLGGLCLILATKVPAISSFWHEFTAHTWVSGFLGSLLGGLVGAFLIWFTRIIATIAFGREAMGLGDIDLMLGIGCVLGPGAAVITFFLAPFCAIGVTIYKLIFRKGREIPLGPYLSMGAGLTMLFYCPIAAYFTPGLEFLTGRLRGMIGM